MININTILECQDIQVMRSSVSDISMELNVMTFDRDGCSQDCRLSIGCPLLNEQLVFGPDTTVSVVTGPTEEPPSCWRMPYTEETLRQFLVGYSILSGAPKAKTYQEAPSLDLVVQGIQDSFQFFADTVGRDRPSLIPDYLSLVINTVFQCQTNPK